MTIFWENTAHYIEVLKLMAMDTGLTQTKGKLADHRGVFQGDLHKSYDNKL